MSAMNSGDLESRIRKIVAEHAALEGPLMPILNAVQAEFSCVPRESIPIIAHEMNLTRAEVFGVVSFYHDYRENPAGRHTIKVCRAEACQSMGGRDMETNIKQLLGLDWHGTTADNAITLEPVYCLGLCAMAPALMIDDQVHGRVTAQKAEKLIAECRT